MDKSALLDEYVVKDGNKFYVDRLDFKTGEIVAIPGQLIRWRDQRGRLCYGEVMDNGVGRDEDSLLIKVKKVVS